MSDDSLKRLREAIAEHPLGPIYGWAADIASLLDRLDKAERENERLREDAERYRWLTDDHPRHETRARVYEIASNVDVRGKGHIDAAIDASRREG